MKKNDKVWVGDPKGKNSFRAVFVMHDPLSNKDGLVAYKIGDFTNVVRWPIRDLRPR